MTKIILLAVLALVIVRALRMLVRGVIVGASGTGSSSPRQAPGRAVKLSRDPVCGTHVSPRTALSISSGGTTYYFCSEKCRDTFRSR